MRAVFDRRIAYKWVDEFARPPLEWLQAGFSSFAYRLAHLALPRVAILSALAATFYIA